MDCDFSLKPVAYIRSDFHDKFGVPRQSNRAPSLTARVVFTPEFNREESLRDIEGFSHLWLIFGFSLVPKDKVSLSVRPPRLGGNKKTGVFASRSPFRPNRLGLSSVRLLGVEKSKTEGYVLLVSGADLVDGTPVFDVKPYLPFTDSHPSATGGYADKEKDHKLVVSDPNELLSLLPSDKKTALIECIADDPRPSYKTTESEYGMNFAGFNIKFKVKNQTAQITSVRKL